MGPFAIAITCGCLDALRWLLWLVALLLIALVAVQGLRADETAQPEKFLIMAAVAGAAGWLCTLLSKRLLPPPA